MRSGLSTRLGRAITLFAIALPLLGVGLCRSAAQSLGSLAIVAPPAPKKRLNLPLSKYKLQDLPLQRLSQEQADYWMRQSELASTKNPVHAQAPAPPPVTPQSIDLTTNPRPPLVGPSTNCIEQHPVWSWDQQSIYFSSNNVDAVGNYGATAPAANAPFHIYRMTSDGAFIQQITGTTVAGESTGNQFFPALNHAQTKLAYVHRDNPSQPYQLYILDFFTGQRTQLTGVNVLNNPLNQNLVSVEHPTWSPLDERIVFAARDKTVAGDPRNLYVLNVISKVANKLTAGTPANKVECFDPIFHPTQSLNRVAFASNANGLAGFDLNYAATKPLQDLRGDGIADDPDRDIFTTPVGPPSAGTPVQRITTSTADDIEPSYNQSVYPANVNPPTGAFNNFLAWSSLGRKQNPANPNEPIGKTYDIYFNNGSSEGANAPIRLFTPDTNAGTIPLNQTDERYPTWSSSLPPQNPIDRIAYASNRKTVVNGDTTTVVPGTAGVTDIWASEVTDITPPTLFTFDDNLGETLHIANAALPNVGRRVGVAGDTFYFYAKVKDGQYGVESVWLQIKDPDNESTDSQGINHKLYGVGKFPGAGSNANNVFVIRYDGTPAPVHFMHNPYETDSRGVGVSDYQYFNDPVRTDVAGGPSGAGQAQYASFNPGVDDAVRWSGNQTSFNPQGIHPTNRPPVDINGNPRWLRLHDDGVFPDLVAGDDVYSAEWVTPNQPSDYYVDLIAYDKAADPRNPTHIGNWIIYDNIWGFSTAPFVSQNQVLIVDDNGAGQKWPRGLKGAFRGFPSYRYGTESELTERPQQFTPRRWVPGPNNIFNTESPSAAPVTMNPPGNPALFFLDGNVIDYDYISYNNGNGPRGRGRAFRYDMWRILAKGPLPEIVINDYVPTKDEQPLTLSGDQTIQRPVPRRAVVWSSPYTGDIFLGAGSILDQATQNLLTTYRNRSGRLVVAGGDILWALTVDGSVQQQFVQDVLGANFTGDAAGSDMTGIGGGPLAFAVTRDLAFPDRFAPGAAPPFWAPENDPDPIGTASSWPDTGSNGPPGSNAGNPTRQAAADGTPFQTLDGVSARPGWEQILDGHMVGIDDASHLSKTIFCSFPLSCLGRRYVTDGDDPIMNSLVDMNYRAKISHAMFGWMFSADLVGQIRNLNGGAPIAGAWIQVTQNGRLVGSAFSRADGTYAVRGLPIGSWGVTVQNPGFLSFNKAVGAGAQALDEAQLDVLLVPAAAGSISGKVSDTFGQPVPNAIIKATLQASPLYTGQRNFFATTINDGTYVIPNAPVGTFDVIVDQPYPNLFSNPQPATQTAVVNPAQNTPNIDFTMTGQPGPLTVKVFPQLGDGTADLANPVQGAEVTLVQGGAPLPGFTLLTDATGTAAFTSVPAGPITVTAFKLGFQEATANVNIPQDSQVTLLLAPAASRPLYGVAIRQIDGQELAAPDLQPAVTLDLLRPVSQLPVGITANVFTPALNAPVHHNYFFPNAQVGRFAVALRNHPRFLDAQVIVDIVGTGNNVAPTLTLIGRPGSMSGVVREDNNGQPGIPIPNALVTILPVNPAGAQFSVTTANDGSWSTAQLPTGVYQVTIGKFGFSTKVLTPNIYVAGDTDTGTTLLLRAPRGQVYGITKRAVDQFPRPAVTIHFVPQADLTVDKTTVSFTPTVPAPDAGLENYTIGSTDIAQDDLPQGTYNVRVTGDPRFQDFAGTVNVIGGQAVRFDINLVPQPGILSGQVRERNPDNSVGVPIPGATVVIRNGASIAATLTTDASGNYQTPSALPAANYTITASAFGYLDGTVTVFVEGPTTAPLILLSPVPPSTISGTVRSKLDSSLISGVTVELLYPVGQVSGPPLPAPATSTDTATGSPAANYTLFPVRPGSYRVRASKPGWKTAVTTVDVPPQINRTVNFLLDPDQIFGKGLLLISLPYDFAGQDAASLFGIPSSDFKAAYWVTPESRYSIYPDPPARSFTLGKGMFVRFPSATAFTQGGSPAPNVPFSLPVASGWNLIGSVRRQRIEWLRVKVATSDGTVRTMQQAYDAGIIQNGLFGYVDGYFRSDFMDPFSGYFMRAFQDCTLIIPVDNSATALPRSNSPKIASRATRPPLVSQVAAELRAAGMSPFVGERVPEPSAVRRNPAGVGSAGQPAARHTLDDPRRGRSRQG